MKRSRALLLAVWWTGSGAWQAAALAQGTGLPPSCAAERFERPLIEAEAAETWAWRIGKLRAQARAEPDDPALRQLQMDSAVRLLTLAALAEAEGNAERATQLRQLTQDGLGGLDLALALDQGAAAGHPPLLAAQIESLWYGVLHAREPAQACAILVSLPADQLGLTTRYRLAQCLQDSDPAASVATMRASAEEGHAAAAEALALLCRYGREPDPECLLSWGCAALSGGRSRLAGEVAEAMLARDIDHGPLARRVLQLAAERGDPAAMHALGTWLDAGRGGPANPTAARQWWERAADLGHTPSRQALTERE